MIIIKPIVYASLTSLGHKVVEEYPQEWATFPVICYTEEDNATQFYADNIEKYSRFRYRIDLWGEDSLSELAVEVDKIMSDLGFKRIFSFDNNDPAGLKHKTLRYTCVIDNDTMMVYHG